MEIDRTKADPVSLGTRWTDGFRLFKSTATHSRSPKVALRSLRLRLVEDTRLAGVLRGSISALAGRGFAVLVNAAIMPLALRYLGKLEFGVWVTISTSVVMLSVLDLGIANTLTNFIAAAHAEDDRQRALRFYSTAFWVTSAVTLVSSSFCVLAWRAIPWAIVFNLSRACFINRFCLKLGTSSRGGWFDELLA
jgi:O-antigen/teichoic acid export membrane protein